MPATRPVEESVATFVRRRFNQEVLDYVANPLVAGIFAGDPEQLSVRHALPRLQALEQSHGSLIKAMIKMPSRRARCRSRFLHGTVSRISRTRWRESSAPPCVWALP